MTPRDDRLTRIERANIQRRLDRWELPHLRHLAAQQAEQLEAQAATINQLQDQLHNADVVASFWQKTSEQLGEEILQAGGQLTLNQAGDFGAVVPNFVHPAAAVGARVLL